MNLVFAPQAWDDYLHWQQTDKKMVRRIHELLKDILRNPHDGIGKPEPLKHGFQGYWSRRMDAEHRLVYRVTSEGLLLAQMRYHYA
jgi:toxin YoeB